MNKRTKDNIQCNNDTPKNVWNSVITKSISQTVIYHTSWIINGITE